MNDFEKALQKICKEDPEYDVLWAQWVYDKRLLTRALQSVGVMFPHYSLHDASHSTTILRQLARVLGQRRIEKLSPTDLWLLLEAAYLHDIGMVVAEAKRREWWRETAFKVHLAKLTSSVDEDLRGAAELLASKAKVENLGDDWPFEIQRALVLVMADYARGQHPRMAEQIVGDPELIGLESPRTKLIPHRAIQLLGKICRHHGSTFEKTFELPAHESGYGTDEAHPLFIACMLRLGDLLDLDDGRFCPVLMKTFGVLPPSSQAHERKHASIERLLVSPTRIEVEAVCEDADAFDEAERWLNWLRNELRDQSSRWAEIVPTSDFGSLPSTGKIVARLKGGVVFEDGRRPRFEVDREAMINLVRGANLYDRPVSFIRELLQNAVDATLLRVWNEHREEILSWEKDSEEQNNVLNKLRQLLGKYPIQVEISHREEPQERPSENEILLHISINDQGWGISRGDIRYLQSIGGSRNNQRKQERKHEMPEWMRPSGIFGIGLQSVFLFTEKLTLTTRADDEFEGLEILLRRGTKGSAGQILAKSLTGREARKTPGTQIDCDVLLPKIPKIVSGLTSAGEVGEILASFDPVKDTALPFEVAAARDSVRLFARESICKIILNKIPVADDMVFDFRGPFNCYFDGRSKIEVKNLRAHLDSNLRVLYRGVETRETHANAFFSGEVDLHFGSADELLMLSREKLRRDMKGEVYDKIDAAILRVFPQYYEELRAKGEDSPEHFKELAVSSLFAELFGQECIPPQKSCGKWRDARWLEGASLGKIDDADIIELKERALPERLGEVIQPARVDIVAESNYSRAIIYLGYNAIDQAAWLWNLASKNRKVTFAVEESTSAGGMAEKLPYNIYRFFRKDVDANPVDGDLALKAILQKLNHAYVGYRCSIPCPREFSRLEINGMLPYAAAIERAVRPRMVSPFCEIDEKIVTPNLVDVVDWTIRNTASHQVRELLKIEPAKARLAVANELVRFIRHADSLMSEEWSGRREYDFGEILFELRKAFGREVVG